MLDARLRPLIDPPLGLVGRVLARLGLTANQVTVAGFLVGILAVPLIAFSAYGAALVVILLNRLMDGIDGALARRRGITDFGGYLDIVLDFIFYNSVVFAFVLAERANAIPAALLMLSFAGTASTFLAFAAIAAKRGHVTTARGVKSFYHLGGLAEGTETILFFVLFCLFPAYFAFLAYLFTALCTVTTASRIMIVRDMLTDDRTSAAS